MKFNYLITSALGQKALHLKNVTVLDLGRLSSTCYDWEWLDNAELLEELHLTFASSPMPTKPTTPITPSTPKGATSTPFPASSPMYENIPEREDDSAAVRLSGEEDFHLQLSFGRLVVTRMSSCSMAVMLHLPKHLKDEVPVQASYVHVHAMKSPQSAMKTAHVYGYTQVYEMKSDLKLGIMRLLMWYLSTVVFLWGIKKKK